MVEKSLHVGVRAEELLPRLPPCDGRSVRVSAPVRGEDLVLLAQKGHPLHARQARTLLHATSELLEITTQAAGVALEVEAADSLARLRPAHGHAVLGTPGKGSSASHSPHSERALDAASWSFSATADSDRPATGRPLAALTSCCQASIDVSKGLNGLAHVLDVAAHLSRLPVSCRAPAQRRLGVATTQRQQDLHHRFRLGLGRPPHELNDPRVQRKLAHELRRALDLLERLEVMLRVEPNHSLSPGREVHVLRVVDVPRLLVDHQDVEHGLVDDVCPVVPSLLVNRLFDLGRLRGVQLGLPFGVLLEQGRALLLSPLFGLGNVVDDARVLLAIVLELLGDRTRQFNLLLLVQFPLHVPSHAHELTEQSRKAFVLRGDGVPRDEPLVPPDVVGPDRGHVERVLLTQDEEPGAGHVRAERSFNLCALEFDDVSHRVPLPERVSNGLLVLRYCEHLTHHDLALFPDKIVVALRGQGRRELLQAPEDLDVAFCQQVPVQPVLKGVLQLLKSRRDSTLLHQLVEAVDDLRAAEDCVLRGLSLARMFTNHLVQNLPNLNEQANQSLNLLQSLGQHPPRRAKPPDVDLCPLKKVQTFPTKLSIDLLGGERGHGDVRRVVLDLLHRNHDSIEHVPVLGRGHLLSESRLGEGSASGCGEGGLNVGRRWRWCLREGLEGRHDLEDFTKNSLCFLVVCFRNRGRRGRRHPHVRTNRPNWSIPSQVQHLRRDRVHLRKSLLSLSVDSSTDHGGAEQQVSVLVEDWDGVRRALERERVVRSPCVYVDQHPVDGQDQVAVVVVGSPRKTGSRQVESGRVGDGRLECCNERERGRLRDAMRDRNGVPLGVLENPLRQVVRVSSDVERVSRLIHDLDRKRQAPTAEEVSYAVPLRGGDVDQRLKRLTRVDSDVSRVHVDEAEVHLSAGLELPLKELARLLVGFAALTEELLLLHRTELRADGQFRELSAGGEPARGLHSAVHRDTTDTREDVVEVNSCEHAALVGGQGESAVSRGHQHAPEDRVGEAVVHDLQDCAQGGLGGLERLDARYEPSCPRHGGHGLLARLGVPRQDRFGARGCFRERLFQAPILLPSVSERLLVVGAEEAVLELRLGDLGSSLLPADVPERADTRQVEVELLSDVLLDRLPRRVANVGHRQEPPTFLLLRGENRGREETLLPPRGSLKLYKQGAALPLDVLEQFARRHRVNRVLPVAAQSTDHCQTAPSAFLAFCS